MNTTFYLILILLVVLYYNYNSEDSKEQEIEHFYYKAKEETLTETEIRNEINTEINQSTQNLTKIVNETVNDVTTSMVNEVASTIMIKNAAKALIKTGDINVKGKGTTVDLESNAGVDAKSKAAIQIVSDVSSLNKMASKLASDVGNKTSNDAAAKASLETLTTAKKIESDAGGPEGMLKAVMGTIAGLGSALTGGKNSSSTNRTLVKNAMQQKFNMSTVNSNDIKNSITNKTNSMVKSVTESKCDFDTSASAEINVGNISAEDGAAIKLKSVAVTKALNDCMVTAANSSGMINDMVNSQVAKTTNDNANKASADGGLKAKTDASQTNESKSAIMSSVDNLVNTGGSIAKAGIAGTVGTMLVGVLVLGGLAFVFKDTISGVVNAKMGVPPPQRQFGGGYNFYGPIFKVLLLIIILNLIISNNK
jgi:hypothetical protein